MDIQYNRSEGYRTVVKYEMDGCEQQANDSSDQQENVNMLDLDEDSDVETTVVFLPNVWSLMPTNIDYQKIVEVYKNFIDNPPVEEPQVEEVAPVEVKAAKNEEAGNSASTTEPGNAEVTSGDQQNVATAESQIKALNFHSFFCFVFGYVYI
jgi:hypothetical protein